MSECKEVVIIIRPSFKKICDDDACRAAVLNHFLYWIARKTKSGSEYWYGSFEEIWESLDRSWGLSKTIQEIKALVADGFIGQRRNPKNGWDQTRHYYFGKEQAETLRATCEKFGVCLPHIGLSPDVLHLLNLTNAFNENNKCICSNQQIDLLDLTDTFVESNDAIPKVYTKDYNKGLQDKEREDVAIATARPQSSSSQEIDPDKTEERHIVKPSQKERANGTPAHPASSSPDMGNAGSPASGRTERQDTNKVTQPPAPKKPPANTIPKRPKQQPITTPVSPEAQRILDDWVSLFTKKIVINQGDIDAAEHLVPTNITCEEMRQERLWLFSTDNPQKPWYRKIGVCLADIDKKYSQWQSLQDAPKPSADKDASNEHRATQQPANAFIERCLDKDYNKRKLEEMREKNALKRQAQAAKGV